MRPANSFLHAELVQRTHAELVRRVYPLCALLLLYTSARAVLIGSCYCYYPPTGISCDPISCTREIRDDPTHLEN